MQVCGTLNTLAQMDPVLCLWGTVVSNKTSIIRNKSTTLIETAALSVTNMYSVFILCDWRMLQGLMFQR